MTVRVPGAVLTTLQEILSFAPFHDDTCFCSDSIHKLLSVAVVDTVCVVLASAFF